ncbi:MAG: BACON domain-containing protein [Chloroflexi bacterium]|nr:BACON domain-containing protein [Chloroflexota bacterium]
MGGKLIAVALAISVALAPYHAHACGVDGTESLQPLLLQVNAAFNLAGAGAMGSDYPPLPALQSGYPEANPMAGSVPCVLLKAIGYVESSWHQATHSVARGSKGPTLVSGGCGYGIMQITSGMKNPGDLPADTQKRIAEEYAYNIAYGAMMLAAKWNYAPRWNPAVGNRNPKVVEDWYYAVWSYNMFTWRNNPNNPDYPAIRPGFDGRQSRTDYPYQELVWGFAANPPKVSGSLLWAPVALTLPDRTKIGTTPGWIPTPSPSHDSPCVVLMVKPASLQITVEPGQRSPFQGVQIDIPGSGNPNWTARANQSWISVIPPSGATVPATLYLSVDASRLARGRYTGQVIVEAPGATGSPQTITVDAQVGTTYRVLLPFLRRGN